MLTKATLNANHAKRITLPSMVAHLPVNRARLRREVPEWKISLNKGSLKQLLPISSNCLHLSNVRFMKAHEACLANLLLELFPPADPQNVCKGRCVILSKYIAQDYQQKASVSAKFPVFGWKAVWTSLKHPL